MSHNRSPDARGDAVAVVGGDDGGRDLVAVVDDQRQAVLLGVVDAAGPDRYPCSLNISRAVSI